MDGSNSLTVLRDRIRMNLNTADQAMREWADCMYAVCLDLAEAREKFKDHAEFGKWCREVDIKMTHQDRAAAIKMGQEPDKLILVLANTDRTSLRQIYEKEWAFTGSGKSPKEDKPKKPKKETEAFEKAKEAIDRRKLVGEPVTYEEVKAEAGVSSTPIRRALAVAEATEGQEVDYAQLLSSTAKEKLAAAVKQHKKKLDLEYDTKVRDGIRKHIEEYVLPNYGDKLKKADTIIAARDAAGRYFPFTGKEYKQVLSALHPDSANSMSAEKRAEIFNLFKSKEAKLRNPLEEGEKLSGTLPKNVIELMAMRKNKR
jgi:hypothetical protein